MAGAREGTFRATCGNAPEARPHQR